MANSKFKKTTIEVSWNIYFGNKEKILLALKETSWKEEKFPNASKKM